MAFPVIAATATTLDANGSTTSVTMPAGIVAGDLLLVFVAHGKAALSQAVDAGWEPLAEQPFDGAAALSMTVYGKVAVGGDTCSLVSTGEETVVHAIRITGHGVGDIDISIVRAIAIGVSPSPNPPNCNPDGELKDRLWIEAFAGQNGSDFATYQSTNFTQVAQAETPGSKALLAVARRDANATALNPGVMAMSAAENWIAVTLAIPPPTFFEASFAASGAFTGLLTDNPLFASMAGEGSVQADISTAIQLELVLSGSGFANGDLSTSIEAEATLPAQATLVAILTTDIPITATIEGVGLVTADLFTAQEIAAALMGAGLVFPPADLRANGLPGISQETLRIAVVEQETLDVVL